MRNFVKAFQILVQVIKTAENEGYETKEDLKEDLFFAFGIMKSNFPEFPFFIERGNKSAIVSEVINENQLEIAYDWLDMEPELKYQNEWDQSEAIEGFEEYLIQQVASKSARRVSNILKPSLEKEFRKELRTNTKREDVLNLYDKLKNEQSKERIVLPSAREEDQTT